MTSLPVELTRKLDSLKENIAGYKKLAIAFSGGVDSSLLLKVSCDVLGENVIAYFADSVVQTPEERKSASFFARDNFASLVVLNFDLLSLSDFVKNPINRCYVCKHAIFSEIIRVASIRGINAVADGTNLDDLNMFRPGLKAVDELGVKSPLVSAGLGKQDIRLISKFYGLSTWNKYSASCLATRINSGVPITTERLKIIEKAELYLINRGFYGCRVRIDGSCSVVELTAGDTSRFIEQEHREDFISFMNTMDIGKVFLDLRERVGVEK